MPKPIPYPALQSNPHGYFHYGLKMPWAIRIPLYFGYDSEAIDYGVPSADSIYGEYFIPGDTTQFQAVWGGGWYYIDGELLTLNSLVLKLYVAFGSSIGFNKTWYPPLTLRWDKSLFYSDVLPFPDNGDAPRAWGEIITEGDMVPEGECSFQYPFIMADTPTLAGLACYHADSMVFQYGSLSGLSFKIAAWQPYWTNIENPINPVGEIQVYPNPLHGNELTISVENPEEIILEIFNIQSSLIYKIKLAGSNSYTFSIDIPPGIYVLQFNQNNIFQTSKFIKL